MRAVSAGIMAALSTVVLVASCGPSDDPCPDKPPTWFYTGTAGVKHHEGFCTYPLPCGLKTDCNLEPDGYWSCSFPSGLGTCSECAPYKDSLACIRAFYSDAWGDAGTTDAAAGTDGG